MNVTVAICTWNRADLLDVALSKMRDLRIPAACDWELLIVNNNCTDHTDAVAEKHAARLPIRLIHEPRPGKSYAANTAMEQAQGDLLLWTDDDALVDSEWVAAYLRAAEEFPEASFFGGPVQPWFEGTPPAWLFAPGTSQILGPVYATRDLGPESFEFTPGRVPYGINMAFRSNVQRRYQFDTSLGPRPGSAIRGEEIALLKAMLNDGFHGRWIPTAQIRHFIPKSRQSVAYLRTFFFGSGQFDARMKWPPDAPTFPKSVPRWLWRQAIQQELTYRLSRLFRQPKDWIPQLMLASASWGKIHELRAMRSESRSGSAEPSLAHAPPPQVH